MKKAPFLFGILAEGAAFTNREEETARLVTNFSNGTNTILISPRRWGKSSLVKHAAGKFSGKKNLRFCFIDLFNIRTEEEFYETLSREVIKSAAGKWQQWLKDAGTFFRQLSPKFSVSPDPSTDLSISLDWQEVKKNPSEILNLAEAICKSKKIRLVICMDEFQNISYYDDPVAFQKKLRAHWQHHQHVTYCLYGSRRHMLMDFFTRPSMPFYKFGDLLFLDKISERYWLPFIQQRFRSTGKNIGPAVAAHIAESMKNHPYFVQQLSQQAWLLTSKDCTIEIVDEAIETLLQQHHFLFQREVDQLTVLQIHFMRALLDGVTKFTSAKNLEKYRIGTSANIKRIREALENKEIIDSLAGRPEFLDPLFELWLQEVYFVK
jgi:AAA+ ATPase superfamily predicted ATPase